MIWKVVWSSFLTAQRFDFQIKITELTAVKGHQFFSQKTAQCVQKARSLRM
jgi:hypothetical protein